MGGDLRIHEELEALVRQVPKGCVASYGSLGKNLRNPVSGFLAGRWMAAISEDAPWWRIVAKSGLLVIAKRDPELALRQRKVLQAEGIGFEGDQIPEKFYWEEFIPVR